MLIIPALLLAVWFCWAIAVLVVTAGYLAWQGIKWLALRWANHVLGQPPKSGIPHGVQRAP